MNKRILDCIEKLEWMKDSPFYAVKQFLLNQGFTPEEISQAVKLYVMND